MNSKQNFLPAGQLPPGSVTDCHQNLCLWQTKRAAISVVQHGCKKENSGWMLLWKHVWMSKCALVTAETPERAFFCVQHINQVETVTTSAITGKQEQLFVQSIVIHTNCHRLANLGWLTLKVL